MDLKKILEVSAAIVLPNFGLIGAYLSYKSSQEAFENGMAHMKLPKKAFLPLFCGLQSAAGYGSYIMWKIGKDLSLATRTGIPMLLYGSQMLLNWAWPAVFQRSLKWSCIESIGLTTLATATAYSFYDTDQTAGLLYLPYVGGLFYLSIENFLAYKKEIEAAFLKTPDTPQITAIQRKVV